MATAVLSGIERGRAEINVGKVKLLRVLMRIAPGVASSLFRNT